MENKFDVVLIGTDVNAYYMARNFHEEYGIKSHVIGRVSMLFTTLSSIIDLTIVPDLIKEDVFVKELVKLAKKIKNKKIILVGCNDDYVSLIIRNKKELSKYYLFNYTNIDLFNTLVNKEAFYKKYGDVLDIPKTYIYNVKEELDENKVSEFRYPVIIKPSNIIRYHECEFPGQAKIYRLNDIMEVHKTIDDIKGAGYDDCLIIQEFIPGDDTRLFDSVFYVNSRGKVELQSFGQIGLQEHTKTGLGNLTVLINGYNEFNNTKMVKDKLKKFLEDIHFNGICEFDLKYDIRDKKFKVFEINARQARSSYYLTACGYNLAKYLVMDLIENKDNEFVFIDNKIALSFVPDFVIRHFIKNKEYKKEFFRLKREGLYTDPLVYKEDMSSKRKKWLFKRDINYIKKYMTNKW